jgi:CheY-like chemotaxis protein
MARILVVDDDAAIRDLLTAVLGGEAEHDVIVAENGCDALDRLRETTVDAVVCDVNMPVMDGIALVRELRDHADTRTLPVLLISTIEPEALDPALEVDMLLTKPFEISTLLASVRHVLARVRHGRGVRDQGPGIRGRTATRTSVPRPSLP